MYNLLLKNYNKYCIINDTGILKWAWQNRHLLLQDKFISTANGAVFGAWCDLRSGPSFGATLTLNLDPHTAVFVPSGVANGYQTLEENVAYTYLVNKHWSPDAKYTMVNAFDPALKIDWPIKKEHAIVSEKDTTHPLLKDVLPIGGSDE